MSSERVLTVTTFNTKMYSVSGRELIRTFGNKQYREEKVSTLLACHEGKSDWANEKPMDHDWLLTYDLDGDQDLAQWLEDNRDVIPEHLGGQTTICSCRNAGERHSHFHKTGCHWHWMNRNASRWFRKVVALRHAKRLQSQFRYLLWVDSDTSFLRKMKFEFYLNQLAGKSMFYFQGTQREAPEVGVMGIDLDTGGVEFIDALYERYKSRRYLEWHRWDDGFHIGVLIKEGAINARDCVIDTPKTKHVIPTTRMGKIISHHKGLHGRIKGIMK